MNNNRTELLELRLAAFEHAAKSIESQYAKSRVEQDQVRMVAKAIRHLAEEHRKLCEVTSD